MISVLGVGTSIGPTAITGELLAKAAPKSTDEIGTVIASTLFSTLLPDYIVKTQNEDVREAINHTVQSTTDMALQASLAAINAAGINTDQIGLILADCATPIETIPGESQRLGSKLGLKIPAFDITTGSAAILGFLTTVSGWKSERLPDYILCVSTNSPTQRVNYAKGSERTFFSDAAGAAIISTRHPGRLEVIEFKMETGAAEASGLTIDIFGHLNFPANNLEKLRVAAQARLLQYSQQFSPGTVLPTGLEAGCALGSSFFLELNRVWDSLRRGDIIVSPIVALETAGGGVVVLRSRS